MNYQIVCIIFIVVFGLSYLPQVAKYIDSPFVKFSFLGLIIYYANMKPLYAIYLILLYFYLYNMSLTREIKENFSHVEAFEELEIMDTDE